MTPLAFSIQYMSVTYVRLVPRYAERCAVKTDEYKRSVNVILHKTN